MVRPNHAMTSHRRERSRRTPSSSLPSPRLDLRPRTTLGRARRAPPSPSRRRRRPTRTTPRARARASRGCRERLGYPAAKRTRSRRERSRRRRRRRGTERHVKDSAVRFRGETDSKRIHHPEASGHVPKFLTQRLPARNRARARARGARVEGVREGVAREGGGKRSSSGHSAPPSLVHRARVVGTRASLGDWSGPTCTSGPPSGTPSGPPHGPPFGPSDPSTTRRSNTASLTARIPAAAHDPAGTKSCASRSLRRSSLVSSDRGAHPAWKRASAGWAPRESGTGVAERRL